jgi:hypothetical protein
MKLQHKAIPRNLATGGFDGDGRADFALLRCSAGKGR